MPPGWGISHKRRGAPDELPRVSFASAHVADFASLDTAVRWRVELARARVPGLRWVKSMATLADRRSGGFGLGPPAPRRHLTVASWEAREAYEEFRNGSALARAWDEHCEHAWHVELTPYRARGTLRGPVRFAPALDGEPEGPIAVLTLGRARWRRVPEFAVRGSRLTESILGAPGVITALSAGFPATGNATFSLWERADDMARFSYARGAKHRATVAADTRNRILAEQIAVRLEPLSVSGGWDPETTPGSAALTRLADQLQSTTPSRFE
jgi:hypothetical protein